MRKFWVALLIVLAGCGGLYATRDILPVAGPDVTILPRARGVAATKDNISIVVVPLQDVKELDGFGILIVNESSHWISFKKEDFMLIPEGGEARHPVSDSQVYARLGAGYKPSMPNGLNVDIYEWRPNVNSRDSRGLQVVDKDEKLSIMGGTKEKIFLYFRTQEGTAPMRFMIPNIYNEATKQRTLFSFKFAVEKS
jgi:phage-related protein